MIRRLTVALLALLLAAAPALAPAWAQRIANPPPSAGQAAGTTTNDNACAGCVGEVISVGTSNATSSGLTMTCTSPVVFTLAAHGLQANDAIYVIGTPCTGITTNTTYYVVGSTLTVNTFTLATTIANAQAGTSINGSGTDSGSNIQYAAFLATATATNILAISLTPGDWTCTGNVLFNPNAATTVTNMVAWIGTVSATQAAFPAARFQDATTYAAGNIVNHTNSVGSARISTATTQNAYLGAQASFAVNTMNAAGFLSCRRAR